MVTDDDLDRIRRKTDEEEAKTRQQVIRELRGRLLEYKVENPSLATIISSSNNDTASEVLFQSGDVCILAQFHTFGIGRLIATPTAVYWHGNFLGHIDALDHTLTKDVTVNFDTERTEHIVLVFPTCQISGLRVKIIDDDPIILATIADELGIGFMLPQLSEEKSHEYVEKIKSTIIRNSEISEDGLSQPVATTASLESIETPRSARTSLVRCGLECIESSSPNTQLISLLNNSDFM